MNEDQENTMTETHRFRRSAVAVVLLAALFALLPALPASARSLLWKVQGKQGVAYLFGSFHAAKEGAYPLPPVVEESFARSRALLVEADLTAVSPEQAVGSVQQRGMLPEGDTLCNHVSAQTCRSYNDYLSGRGMIPELFAGFKPWFAATMISLLEVQQQGYEVGNGVDLYFTRKAKGKKQIVELESVDYQFSLLDSFTPREQELFLISTMREGGEKLDAAYQAWRSGDAAALEEAALGELKRDRSLEPVFEKLIFARNRTMAAAIERRMQGKEPVFVVVGAAHLVGPRGIVELLRRKGYRVEQR